LFTHGTDLHDALDDKINENNSKDDDCECREFDNSQESRSNVRTFSVCLVRDASL